MIGVSDIKVVPFAQDFLTSNWQEYVKVNGLLRLYPNAIEIEYHYDLSVLNSSGGQYDKKEDKSATLTIPFTELEDMTLKKGWFGSKIMIQAKRLDVLKDFPAQKSGLLTLQIARGQVKNAEALVSRAMLIRSEIMLTNL